MAIARGAAAVALLLAWSCGGGSPPPGPPSPQAAPVEVRMDFAVRSEFYAAPFPSEHRRRGDGGIDLDSFPNPDGIGLVEQIRTLLTADADGFGTTSGIFFALSDPIDAELPSLHESVAPGAAVFLMNAEPGSSERLVRHPIEVGFVADGGPFGAANLLVALPAQGFPLAPRSLYVAAVLASAAPQQLAPSRVVARLAAGERVEGLSDGALEAYRTALEALGESGIAAEQIAGIAAFRTGDPVAGLRAARRAALASAPLEFSSPFRREEIFDEFCVYASIVDVPVYQQGEPPYASSGGGWVLDEAGEPVLQRLEPARVVVTIPRRTMPAAGFPVVLLSRTGAGGDRPLVDRGPRAAAGGPSIAPGTGPAATFARAGFAGMSVDGPHGGIRNPSGGDEQFLVFNVTNPPALRDNLRQSALELALTARALGEIAIDASDCPAADTSGSPARFDVRTVALMGHSMGASIAPLALAVEPRFGALILSGAGGSFLANIVFKQSPIEIKPLAEALLGYAGKRELGMLDPALSLVQWAADPADVPAYGRELRTESRADRSAASVLMLQGIVDTYILPPIANTASLSLGLDLAGPIRDTGDPRLERFTPLAELLPLAGRSTVPLPVAGNQASGFATRVVVQHLEDGIEDGHEVVFQREEPKEQIRCFLAGFAAGATWVPASTCPTQDDVVP